MTVEELIKELQKIENKKLPVGVSFIDTRGYSDMPEGSFRFEIREAEKGETAQECIIISSELLDNDEKLYSFTD